MPTITYEKKEGRFGVLTILVDGDPWRDIHSHIFGRKPSLHSTCTTLADLETQFPALEYRGAMAYTVKRLSLKSQPSTELIKSLEDRLVSAATIERIISECQHLGYLNDHDWLESFTKRQMARHLGPQAIAMKLRAKGISQEHAEQIMSRLDNPELQTQRIRHLLATRYRSRDLSDYHTREKVTASLVRKGFSFQEIRNAMTQK